MNKTEKILCLIAAFYCLIALFFFTSIGHTQVLSDKALADKVAVAQVGDLLKRHDNIEVFKGKGNELVAHVFSAPQFDKSGNPLMEATVSGDTVFVGEKYYLIFNPDTATAKLKKTVQRGNASTKVEYTVTDNKTPKLSWTLYSNATVIQDASKKLIFYGDKGEYLMECPLPTARDAKGKSVTIGSEYKTGTLTYALLVTGNTIYPVMVDPTTSVTSGTGLNGRASQSSGGVPHTYLWCRDGLGNDNYPNYLPVGQICLTPDENYSIDRSFLCFPTIPAMVTVSACTLYLDGYPRYTNITDYDVNIVGARAWKSTIGTNDFTHFHGWAASGTYTGTLLNNTWNTSSWSANWNTLVFNAAGRDSLFASSGDSLWIAMLSSRDYTPTEPTGYECYEFTGGDSPYISFTYVPPVGLTRSMPYDKTPNTLWLEGAAVPLWKP